MAKAFRPLKPRQRIAIKSYVECVFLGTMSMHKWHTSVDEAPEPRTWSSWNTQEKFARALSLYCEHIEQRRLSLELQRQVEIAQYEAQTRYLVAQAKPLAANRLAEIAADGSEREAVSAGKAILDYDTTPPMTATETADAFLRASVPLEAGADENPNPE